MVLPGGAEVEKLPCIVEDMSSIPGPGTKIPRSMPQLLSPSTAMKSLKATQEDPVQPGRKKPTLIFFSWGNFIPQGTSGIVWKHCD